MHHKHISLAPTTSSRTLHSLLTYVYTSHGEFEYILAGGRRESVVPLTDIASILNVNILAINMPTPVSYVIDFVGW